MNNLNQKSAWMIAFTLCLIALSVRLAAQEQFELFSTQQTEQTNQANKNEPFGRLFSEPIERKNLDALRKNQKLTKETPPQIRTINTQTVYTPQALPKPITLQGYVKRSDGGKNTIWINNQAVQENSTINDVKIGRLTKQQESKNMGIIKSNNSQKSIERLEINIPATGKHIQLKAGQRYEPEGNRIKEVTTVAREKQLQLLETPDNDELSIE